MESLGSSTQQRSASPIMPRYFKGKQLHKESYQKAFLWLWTGGGVRSFPVTTVNNESIKTIIVLLLELCLWWWLLEMKIWKFHFSWQFIFVCRCRCCEHQVRKEAKPELWSVIWSANCDLQNQASLLHVHCSRNARKIMKKKILHREKSSENLLNFCHSYSSESENILNVILCNYPLKTCQG